ncbi:MULTISPECIES: hypothetical protein [Sulfurisphaera]|nr:MULTISPECIES: hypothetical protein [Sulfurisphaera]MBB5252599.1 ABC-type multidrug transport system permease subunit [Sulfurisphaera ohwakuensis]
MAKFKKYLRVIYTLRINMSLQNLANVTSQIAGMFHFNASPLATGLIVVGLAIVFMVLIGAIIYGLIKAFKELPNMPFRTFVVLMLVLAMFLIIVGVLLP